MTAPFFGFNLPPQPQIQEGYNGNYHAVSAWQREAFARGAPREISLTERKLWEVNSEDHNYRAQYLHGLPDYLAGYFGERYTRIYQSSRAGRRHANMFLRSTLGKNILPRLRHVTERYRRDYSQLTPFVRDLELLPTYDRSQIKDFAWRAASHLSEFFFSYTEHNFEDETDDDQNIDRRAIVAWLALATEAKTFGTIPPYWGAWCAGKLTARQAESGLLRMMSPLWWQGRIKRRRDTMREHLAISVGQVQRAASPYVSRSTLGEWVEQKRRNREFFRKFDLVNDEGQSFSMIDMVARSVANPAIRRHELMARMRGFEDLANERGHAGVFYTITAPSKYHSTHSKGGFVEQWAGASPRDTQQYLCGVWARIRAELKRNKISVFGFRVAEPHHDGTPHWHLLLFMEPESQEYVTDVMRRHSCRADAGELTGEKARDARFNATPIDPEKGSATGYIAKYISKNIDGYALDGEQDDETGENLRDMSKAVSAWASRWRIRQFQQIGCAPVTVWRELRRLRDIQLPDQKMDAVLAAADAGDWAAYVHHQGGPLVSRHDLIVRLTYNTTEMGNEYGEDVQRVSGIYSPQVHASEVCTRLTTWRMVPKADAVAAAGVSGGNAAPWSSVNNCTGVKNCSAGEQDQSGQKSRIFRILASAESQGITITRAQAESLARGARLMDGKRIYQATPGGGLRQQRSGKNERLASMMRRAQERGGVSPEKASRDPHGYWRQITRRDSEL